MDKRAGRRNRQIKKQKSVMARWDFNGIARDLVQGCNLDASHGAKSFLCNELKKRLLCGVEKTKGQLLPAEKKLSSLLGNMALIEYALWLYGNEPVPIKEAIEMHGAAQQIAKEIASRAGVENKRKKWSRIAEQHELYILSLKFSLEFGPHETTKIKKSEFVPILIQGSALIAPLKALSRFFVKTSFKEIDSIVENVFKGMPQ